MKIGIYGGTFDPIHHGHLLLARDAVETLGLDKVIFFPAKVSPHKTNGTASPAEVRYEMLAAAIEGEPKFEASDFEIRRTPPSYTIDTLRMIHESHPEAELFLLLGADNLAELHTWKDIDLIRDMARLVIFGRGPEVGHDQYIIPRRIDISATEIRKRVANGLSIRYLVPEKACRVLENKKLYQP